MNIPQHWMNEASGVLRPAVEAYLEHKPMHPRQIAAIRVYLRQWMAADWKGPMIDPLRTKVGEIVTQEDLREWFKMADVAGMDPL